MERDRSRVVTSLHTSRHPLWRNYDVAMLDLDGVVYRGETVIAQAPQRLRRLRARGLRLAFVTNNAARTPAVVAAQLQRLGVPAQDTDVVTSAQAAARVAAGLAPTRGRVLVVGGDGLRQALAEHGLTAIASAAERPDVVAQGFAPELGWALLAEGAYAVAAGVPWVATNLDQTIPTSSGIAPGNGTLVAAITAATGRRPVVAGKPEPALFDETLLRVGGTRPLVVGDRLDTDIAGANRAGADSLLVLTGVTDLDRLSAACPAERPTFVAVDLSGLESLHTPVDVDGASATCGPWRVSAVSGAAEISRSAAPSGGAQEATDLMRAAVTIAWRTREGDGERLGLAAVSAQLREMMS